jgi:hypothetical protein
MDYSTLNPRYYKDPRTGEVAGIMYSPEGFTISVPIDENNSDYRSLMEWAKEEGNTIEEAD